MILTWWFVQYQGVGTLYEGSSMSDAVQAVDKAFHLLDGKPDQRATEVITMDNVVRVEAAPVTGSQRVRALLGAILCVLFLLNLSGGWLEIPDCLPLVGNLDEVAATVMLMRCLERLEVSVLPPMH